MVEFEGKLVNFIGFPGLGINGFGQTLTFSKFFIGGKKVYKPLTI